MNRKQKIIVSTTGIFLVLLILVGLTYAYFLTRINGNTNDKSISVTTANLRLVYSDGTDGVIGGTNIEPSDTVYTKTFTVKSEGNKNIEYGVYLINVINQLTRKEDIKYTLECTTDGTIKCNGVNETTFPSGISQLITNTIEPGKTHTYTFKFTYKDTGTDQSIDMGKELSAKIQIFGKLPSGEYFPYEEGTLSYNIINNAKNNLNGTELVDTPNTKVAEEISTKWSTGEFEEQELDMSSQSSWYYGSTYNDAQPWNGGSGTNSVSECNDTIVGKYISYPTVGKSWYIKSCKNSTVAITAVEVYDYEKELSITVDDYGISYYYRGNVIDNYVNFAGMCWRVVRIAGDGSIKLILEDQDEECSKTMDGNWDIPTTTGGTTKKGNFGYTQHAANTLTASDGTQNSSTIFLMNYLNGGTNNSTSMATAFKNFQTGSLANYLDELKAGDWCLNDKAYATSSDNTTALTNQEILDKQVKNTSFYYDSYVRLQGKETKEPTLKCNGTNMNKFVDNTDMYVGTLTADEIVYAGGKVEDSNTDYYLINDYQKSNGLYFCSFSLDSFDNYFDSAFFVFYGGNLRSEHMNLNSSLRPAISLKSNTQISNGNGTKENPYVVKTS